MARKREPDQTADPTADVLLIRHGRSEGQGRTVDPITDDPLSAEGKRQARALRARLRADGITVDVIFVSPLRRALQVFFEANVHVDRLLLTVTRGRRRR